MNSGKDFLLWGAGIWGCEIIRIWGKNGCKGFIDSNSERWGTTYSGVEVLSPEDALSRYLSAKIIICTRLYYSEIVKQLSEMGVCEDRIINAGDIIDGLAAKQYFSLDELPHDINEVFADVGSFDGKSSVHFAEWSGEYSKIYCFEPDKKNIPKCECNLEQIIQNEKVEIIRKGVWSSETTLRFSSIGSGASALSDTGEDRVDVTTIDTVFENRDVSFIKMDIEGAEYEALIGAEKTIKKQKPKLAICVYHKPEDIIAIPSLILSMNPEYKLYLRHYSIAAAETVLYAI